jgi:uncharacterized protein YegL
MVENGQDTDKGLFVVTGMWDDLGAVLRGLGYEYHKIGGNLGIFKDTKLLQGCKVLFVACGANCSLSERAAKNILEFVEQGGAIYASDLACDVVENLFGDKAIFESESYENNVRISVVDPGLAEIIGPMLQLHHDTEIRGIRNVSSGVKVLLKGPRKEGGIDQYPYLIAFNYGEGQVIYTVFHNSKQVSEIEKKLLNYLIFRPIMSGAARSAAQLVQAQMATPGKEIFTSINPGETSTRFGVNVASPMNLIFVLSWEGNATLGVQVWNPSGKLVKEGTNSKSPFTVEVLASQPGTWTCAIQGQSVPHRNFPYVLTIASRGGKLAGPGSVTAVPAPVGRVAPSVNTAKTFPIYLVVDTSSKVSDVLNPLTAGLRQFGDRLRGRSYRDYRANISLLQANDTGKEVIPLTDAARYSTPAMNGHGRCRLGLALNNLLTSLSSNLQGAKPLIIILLAGVPEDDWSEQAKELREIAAQRRANVFVVGLGGYADASVLKRLTTSTPLVLPVVTQVYSQQLFEWLYNIIDLSLNGLESGGSGQHKKVPLPPACLRGAV